MCNCDTRRRFEHCNTCSALECAMDDECTSCCTCNAVDDGAEPEEWCDYPGCTLRPDHAGPCEGYSK